MDPFDPHTSNKHTDDTPLLLDLAALRIGTMEPGAASRARTPASDSVTVSIHVSPNGSAGNIVVLTLEVSCTPATADEAATDEAATDGGGVVPLPAERIPDRGEISHLIMEVVRSAGAPGQALNFLAALAALTRASAHGLAEPPRESRRRYGPRRVAQLAASRAPT